MVSSVRLTLPQLVPVSACSKYFRLCFWSWTHRSAQGIKPGLVDVVGQEAKREEEGGERKGHVRHPQACISDGWQHCCLSPLGSGLCSEKDTPWSVHPWIGLGTCHCRILQAPSGFWGLGRSLEHGCPAFWLGWAA